MAEQDKVTLLCSDEKVIEMENEVAMQMGIIKRFIELGGTRTKICVPNVSSTKLAKVIEYIKYHLEANKSGHSEEDIKTWDRQFVDVDEATLFDLIMASDYLNINNLFEFLCQTVADMIKDLSPEQTRQLFGIENDYTREEEEKLRRQFAWAYV